MMLCVGTRVYGNVRSVHERGKVPKVKVPRVKVPKVKVPRVKVPKVFLGRNWDDFLAAGLWEGFPLLSPSLAHTWYPSCKERARVMKCDIHQCGSQVSYPPL
jgi:hypothetical protein